MTNVKKTRNALVFSMLSLLLCVSTFVGSTFAWFTDTVSTNVNSIQAGKLDIDLIDEDGESLDGKSLSFVNKKGSSDILWEPGATYRTQGFKLENKGNLQFKYKIVVNTGSIDSKLKEVISFALVDGEGNSVKLGGESQNDTVGTYKCTFDEEGKNVCTLTGPLATELMYIEAHMDEEAGNEYQGLTLNNISITVYATQTTYEYDSFTDQYDKDALYDWDGKVDEEFKEEIITTTSNVIEISTPAELKAFADAVNVEGKNFADKTIKLTADIDLNNKEWTPIGQTGATEFKGVFDGQGHTIKNLYINNTDESASASTGLFGWIESHGNEGVTIKNVNIDGANVSGHHYVGVVVGYVYGTVENCNVVNATVSNTSVNDDANGDKTGGIVGYVGEDATIKNCTVEDSTISSGRDAGQVVGAAKESTITGCSATNVTVTANGTSTGNNIRNEVIGRVL